MSTKALLAKLRSDPEGVWGDLSGKPLDARGLANRLRPYGVTSRVVRVGDKTPRGYRRQDLYDAWERYLSLSPHGSATSATSDDDEGLEL